MTISLKKKLKPTENDLSGIEIKLQKVKKLHAKVNQFKLKVEEFKYNKKEWNPDDILKNI
jgi:hypothetical protein